MEDDTVKIRKAEGCSGRGRALVEHMRGRGTFDMTTAEIVVLMRGDD